MKLYVYVPEYWVPVGARSLTRQATKTTREGSDDEEQRSRSNRLIVGASSDRVSIMVAEHLYKYKYSNFRENSRNTEVLQKIFVLQEKENWAEKRREMHPILGIESKSPYYTPYPVTSMKNIWIFALSILISSPKVTIRFK